MQAAGPAPPIDHVRHPPYLGPGAPRQVHHQPRAEAAGPGRHIGRLGVADLGLPGAKATYQQYVVGPKFLPGPLLREGEPPSPVHHLVHEAVVAGHVEGPSAHEPLGGSLSHGDEPLDLGRRRVEPLQRCPTGALRHAPRGAGGRLAPGARFRPNRPGRRAGQRQSSQDRENRNQQQPMRFHRTFNLCGADGTGNSVTPATGPGVAESSRRPGVATSTGLGILPAPAGLEANALKPAFPGDRWTLQRVRVRRSSQRNDGRPAHPQVPGIPAGAA